MTPARKKALQWFYDRGEVDGSDFYGAVDDCGASMSDVKHLWSKGYLIYTAGYGIVNYYSLTDKGRRALHGDDA